MPSLKKNVTFNYIGQFYTAFIGILILPFYLQELGAEAFGLIGFFTLLLAWLQLLDLGMTPTLGREVARLKGDISSHHELRTVVRTLEVVFFFVAVVVTCLIFLEREWFALEWLSFNELDGDLVASCVGIMAAIVGVRWLTSLYMSGIYAYEQQVWINLVNIFIVSLRYPGALAVVYLTYGNILMFFAYQLALSVIEFFIYMIKLYRLMPEVNERVRFSSRTFKRIAPFALSIGYTAGIWVFITQLDKLLFSKILPLAEYGYLTLVASLAGGILLLSGPIGKAVLPRMTSLLAAGKEADMLKIYMTGTKLVSVIVAPIVAVIACFPKEVVYVWTGNVEAALWVEPILPLYALGFGVLTVSAFQYYLQYAHGRLKHHVYYGTVSAIISIPLIFYAAYNYGPVGVAWVWFIFRVVSILFWAPYVHHKFAPGIHLPWIFKNVVPQFSIAALCVALAVLLGRDALVDRMGDFFFIATVSIMTLIATFAVSFPQQIKTRLLASRVTKDEECEL